MSYIYIQLDDIAYNGRPYTHSVYRFPEEYNKEKDVLLDLISAHLFCDKKDLKVIENMKAEELDLRAMDLHYIFTPDLILRLIILASVCKYRFFLIDRNMTFDYFINNWKRRMEFIAPYFRNLYKEGIDYIEKNYNELRELAIIEKNEDIIREII